jgi:phosphate starvation-inducible PhoH-like protein
LSDAIDLLGRLEPVGHVRFRHGDVVRHDLVRQIVEAYETAKSTEAAKSTGRTDGEK